MLRRTPRLCEAYNRWWARIGGCQSDEDAARLVRLRFGKLLLPGREYRKEIVHRRRLVIVETLHRIESRGLAGCSLYSACLGASRVLDPMLVGFLIRSVAKAADWGASHHARSIFTNHGEDEAISQFATTGEESSARQPLPGRKRGDLPPMLLTPDRFLCVSMLHAWMVMQCQKTLYDCDILVNKILVAPSGKHGQGEILVTRQMVYGQAKGLDFDRVQRSIGGPVPGEEEKGPATHLCKMEEDVLLPLFVVRLIVRSYGSLLAHIRCPKERNKGPPAVLRLEEEQGKKRLTTWYSIGIASGSALDEDFFAAALHAAATFEETVPITMEMKARNIQPGEKVYHQLMRKCAGAADVRGATSVYELWLKTSKKVGRSSDRLTHTLYSIMVHQGAFKEADALYAVEKERLLKIPEAQSARFLSHLRRKNKKAAEAEFLDQLRSKEKDQAPHILVWRRMLDLYIVLDLRQELGELLMAYMHLSLPKDRYLWTNFEQYTNGCQVGDLPRTPGLLNRLEPDIPLPPSWLEELRVALAQRVEATPTEA